ncbi:MAG: imidazole glycerol phosphate synthase cyclase subunit [bacterium]
MLTKRIIPILLLKNGRMVKGVNFNNYRDTGNPITAVKVYNSQKVDELIFLDIDQKDKKIFLNTVLKATEPFFMPFTAGGGIRSLQDIRDALNVGADKISINTVAVENPQFIKQAAEKYGRQCIVVSVDYKGNKIYTHCGKMEHDINPLEHIKRCVELGAGEILLTNIDLEGTMSGYDLEFCKLVSESVNVPVIINGGAATYNDFMQAFENKADAVAASSMFHFTDQTPIRTKYHLLNAGVNVRT